MRKLAISALLAAPLILFGAGPSLAWSDCSWRSCYAPVYVAPPGPVVLRAGWREVVPVPPVVVRRVVPVEPNPGRWRTAVSPPLYGVKLRRVSLAPGLYEKVETPILVRPGRVAHFYEPAVYGYINRTVAVRPASAYVIYHPPVIRYERPRILVGSGPYLWPAHLRNDRW